MMNNKFLNMESIATQCSALLTSKNRSLSLTTSTDASNPFRFVIIADPQLGLLEQYVEKRPRPHHWDREVKLVDRAMNIVNRLCPKPSFVVICGDLVNDQPGGSDKCKQTSDLLDVLSHLDSNIPLIVLPGNHDVGDCPNENGVQDYRSVWGDDYFSFIFNRIRFIVINTQYLMNDSKCASLASEFRQWFYEQISLRNKDFDMSVLFQHVPFFLEDLNEPDNYFNIPMNNRNEFVKELHKNQIYYAFSGHLHKNNISTYTPPTTVNKSNNITVMPFSMISSSSVCVQLGNDQPGLRLVQINNSSNTENCLKHVYWSLDELEEILNSGKQPEI
ncbi:Serine/threonine-protein phosphatase CPPED1 [Schistosoma japonicum]|nr:Serine/threonine-protein phosphatase CPPED1 [Schistosoma japonicum]